MLDMARGEGRAPGRTEASMVTLLSRRGIIVRNKTEAFRLIGLLVHEDLGRTTVVDRSFVSEDDLPSPTGQCRTERIGSEAFDRSFLVASGR